MTRLVCLVIVVSSVLAHAQQISRPSDSYDVLLHSESIGVQRAALAVILHDPQKYIPRIQRSLRDYPRLLRSDRVAANRAVYLSALVRDPSFPALLAKNLGDPDVLDECEYPCPIVFALTTHASFAGWKLPSNLDSRLTTVNDLRSSIETVAHLTLKVEPLEAVVQGPALEKYKKDIEGKTEEELIQVAGPANKDDDSRLFAVYRLETLVTTGKNRTQLYLLAFNELIDGSGEYRDAVYNAIYRAELAKVRSMGSSSCELTPLSIDGFSFQSPTKELVAAHNVDVITHETSTN